MLSIDKVQLDLASGPLGKLDDMALRDVIKAIRRPERRPEQRHSIVGPP
jgi:hypothetical protein